MNGGATFPPRGSRVTTSQGAPGGSRRRTTSTLAPGLRGDLDWITLKALEKDRTRRYASASQFAGDIERYLSDEPVTAGPPSAAYRLTRTVRRHRVVIGATASIVLALAVGLAIATAMYLRSEASRREADRERDIASQMYATAERLRGEADAQRGVAVQQTQIAQSMYERSESARAEAERQRQAADHKSYVATTAAADLLVRSNQIVEVRNRLAQVPPASHGWEWHYLYAESDWSTATLGSDGGAVTSVQFTPDVVHVARRGVSQDGQPLFHPLTLPWVQRLKLLVHPTLLCCDIVALPEGAVLCVYLRHLTRATAAVALRL